MKNALLLVLATTLLGCSTTRPNAGRVADTAAPAACATTRDTKPDLIARGTVQLQGGDGGCRVAAAPPIVTWDGAAVTWNVTNGCGADVRMELVDTGAQELDLCEHETTIPAAGGQLTCTLKKVGKARCAAYAIEWEAGSSQGQVDAVLDIRH